MSQRIETETPDFARPAEFDPDWERIDPHPLYLKITRQKRTEKPGRRLTYRTPTSPEMIQLYGELSKNYLMEIDPFGWAGNHYHEKKVEVFCSDVPLPLIVFLQHRETGEKDVIVLANAGRETYEEFLIIPKVVHFIANPSGIIVPYNVLSNMSEAEALKTGDVIYFPIDATTCPFPPDIPLTPQLQSLLASSKSLK